MVLCSVKRPNKIITFSANLLWLVVLFKPLKGQEILFKNILNIFFLFFRLGMMFSPLIPFMTFVKILIFFYAKIVSTLCFISLFTWEYHFWLKSISSNVYCGSSKLTLNFLGFYWFLILILHIVYWNILYDTVFIQ